LTIISSGASVPRDEIELTLRIRVVDPPPGVRFQVQRGRAELVPPARETSRGLCFDLAVRVAQRPTGEPNFLGPFAQGPPDARFVYVNSGTLAGQADSCWSRRAKVPLTGITWPQVRQADASRVALETTMPGTGTDGGPTCATVKQIVWRVGGT
jgi:hypothetical protein